MRCELVRITEPCVLIAHPEYEKKIPYPGSCALVA